VTAAGKWMAYDSLGKHGGTPVALVAAGMAERTQCIKCGRAIDAYARICPYCNWDQNEPVPAVVAEQQSAVPDYVPPPDHRVRNRILGAVGGVVLLIAAFGIGSLVHGRNPPPTLADKDAAATAAAAMGKPSPRANVTLVPVTDTNPDVEAPIMTAPLPILQQNVPAEYQRTDATAVASDVYAQMAQRANAEKKKKKPETLVDPRSITTPAVAPGDSTPPPQTSAAATTPADADRQTDQVNFPSPPAHVVVSTRPVPIYQPLPDVNVTQPTTAKLQLTVGPDGDVKEVTVLQGIPGETGKIIASLQRWKFKPATENGSPVEAPFTVDVSFNPHE
jgi:TonB-like protein